DVRRDLLLQRLVALLVVVGKNRRIFRRRGGLGRARRGLRVALGVDDRGLRLGRRGAGRWTLLRASAAGDAGERQGGGDTCKPHGGTLPKKAQTLALLRRCARLSTHTLPSSAMVQPDRRDRWRITTRTPRRKQCRPCPPGLSTRGAEALSRGRSVKS